MRCVTPWAARFYVNLCKLYYEKNQVRLISKDNKAQTGKATFEDIQRRIVAPMQQVFRKGDRDAGIAAFIDYVFNDPHGWDNMSEAASQGNVARCARVGCDDDDWDSLP